MFKLYPIDFREFPYIDIKIGEGCTAACTDCRYNINYLKQTKQYSLESILKKIDYVDRLFDKKFNLVFGNQDFLNHKDIFKILDRAVVTGREIRIQTDFVIDKKHIDTLKIIQDKYNNISIKIAQNARVIDGINKKLFNLLNIFNTELNLKLYLDIFIDFETNLGLINLFKTKFGNTQSENEYSFNIGKKFELKFHNYSWRVDYKNKTINNFNRKSCQHLDQFYTENNNIFIKDSVDVYDNGDIFIHDNLCNIGDIRITNLYFEKQKIYSDFQKYLNHLNLNKSKFKTQTEMCYDCITNGYKY